MNEIIPSFKKSLFDYNLDTIIDISELGIDSIMKPDLLGDFPFAKFIYGVNTIKFYFNDILIVVNADNAEPTKIVQQYYKKTKQNMWR